MIQKQSTQVDICASIVLFVFFAKNFWNLAALAFPFIHVLLFSFNFNFHTSVSGCLNTSVYSIVNFVNLIRLQFVRLSLRFKYSLSSTNILLSLLNSCCQAQSLNNQVKLNWGNLFLCCKSLSPCERSE